MYIIESVYVGNPSILISDISDDGTTFSYEFIY